MLTSYAVSRYAASEADCLITPRVPWAGTRGVIYCHGANRTATDGTMSGYADIPRAVGADFPVSYADLGGLYTFGNATSQARLGDAKTYIQAAGAMSGKVILMGGSMGAALACNYARANPTLVQALALFIPSVDMEDIRANNRASLQANIETAYTNNAGWQAVRSTHNPVEYAHVFRHLGIPLKVWYSTSDPTCIPARTSAFIDAAQCESHSLGPVGHDVTGIDLDDVRNWVRSHA